MGEWSPTTDGAKIDENKRIFKKDGTIKVDKKENLNENRRKKNMNGFNDE